MRIFLLILTIALPSCTTVKTEDSNVKYGFLSREKIRIVRKPDGSVIKACGAYLDHLQWAVDTWSEPIGKSYRVERDCNDFEVAIFSNTDPFSVQTCQEAGLNGRGFYTVRDEKILIVLCPGREFDRPFLLHEVGHAFGLCDQYEPQIGKCTFTTNASLDSIMHSATSESLSQDDIDGIRRLNAHVNGNSQQPNGATITLEEGIYQESGGTRWYVKPYRRPQNASYDIMNNIIITLNDTDYYFACGASNICTRETSSIELIGQSSNMFSHQKAGITTIFRRVPNTLNLSQDRVGAGSGDNRLAPSSATPPAGQTAEFLIDRDRVGNCEDKEACERAGNPPGCKCRQWDTCWGMEVFEYCTQVHK